MIFCNAVILGGPVQCLYKLLLPECVTLEMINRCYRGFNAWFIKHPLLKGLSQNCTINDQYVNVAPQYIQRMKTIEKLKGETVMGFTTHYQFGNPNI